MYKEQLKELQQQLFLAQDCVLAAFTGTMIPEHAEGGRQLLDTIKGSNHINSCDEVSSLLLQILALLSFPK